MRSCTKTLIRYETLPLEYPNVIGFTFAGVVKKVGPGVDGISIGDNVVAFRKSDKLNDPQHGAFSQYALADAKFVSKLLPGTALEAGAASIMNLKTVASALSIYSGLDQPSLSGNATPKHKKVLIYGGSSSCGGLGIRYALGAGYDVVTTSSPRNREYVESLGPQVIVDHTQSAQQIVETLHANGPYHAILDTIGVPSVTEIIAGYLSDNGGGSYCSLVPHSPDAKPVPENVERRFEVYTMVFGDSQYESFSKWFFEKLLPEGLATGIIVPTRPQWIKGGLEQAQHALDIMDNGEVSGHKLVLDPWAEAVMA